VPAFDPPRRSSFNSVQEVFRVQQPGPRFDTVLRGYFGPGEEGLAPPEFLSGKLSKNITCSSGVVMPRMIYHGDLVLSALRSGFRRVDTFADQELSIVGDAIARMLALEEVGRKDLFIQTKVRPEEAAKMNPDAPVKEQVDAFIKDALEKLALEKVDSLVLEFPYKEHEHTMEAWRSMEEAVDSGVVGQLGIARVKGLEQLRRVYADARHKPAVVQQPLIPEFGYERGMRAWCNQTGIAFQTTSTLGTVARLTSWNGADTPERAKEKEAWETTWNISKKYLVTPPALFLRFVMGMGAMPCVATKSSKHMEQDLAATTLELTAEDAQTLEKLVDMNMR